MNRVDTSELAVFRGDVAISIYAHCALRGGCIASLNRMCLEAAQMLRKKFDGYKGEAWAEKLLSLEGYFPVSGEHTMVVLLVNKYINWVYPLIAPLPEKIFIQDSFVLSPVNQQLYRLDRYWVLVIFHGVPYLFEGYPNGILEVYHRHTTYTGEEYVALQDVAGLVCSEDMWGKKCRYKGDDEFIRSIDKAFRHFLEGDPLPYLCIADEKSARDFSQYSSYAHDAMKVVAVSHQLSVKELHHVAWKAAEPWFHQHRRKTYQEILDATKANMCVWDIPRIWHYLHDDSIRCIVVNRSLAMPGCEDRAASAIFLGDHCKGAEPIDAIDSLLDAAHRRGIPVVLFDEHELDAYNGIVAILTSGQESLRE